MNKTNIYLLILLLIHVLCFSFKCLNTETPFYFHFCNENLENSMAAIMIMIYLNNSLTPLLQMISNTILNNQRERFGRWTDLVVSIRVLSNTE